MTVARKKLAKEAVATLDVIKIRRWDGTKFCVLAYSKIAANNETKNPIIIACNWIRTELPITAEIIVSLL